jgi:hypothetical protein
VVLSIDDYRELLEDLEDLAAGPNAAGNPRRRMRP